MLKNISLPPILKSAINNEDYDFAVKARLEQPRSQSYFIIIFSIAWLIFAGGIIASFIFTFIQSNDISLILEDLSSLIVPGIFMSIFILVGIFLLIYGVKMFFKEGSYYIGAKSRLIQYKGDTIRSIDWEQFTGDIKITENNNEGNIELQLRTGQMYSDEGEIDEYVPDIIQIVGITNFLEIEKVCRKRIKENDPTPTKKDLSYN